MSVNSYKIMPVVHPNHGYVYVVGGSTYDHLIPIPEDVK